MRVKLSKECRHKLPKGDLKGVIEIRSRIKIYGVPGVGGGEGEFRILEDGDFRITESGDFRILQ